MALISYMMRSAWDSALVRSKAQRWLAGGHILMQNSFAQWSRTLTLANL